MHSVSTIYETVRVLQRSGEQSRVQLTAKIEEGRLLIRINNMPEVQEIVFDENQVAELQIDIVPPSWRATGVAKTTLYRWLR